ncbi:MAG: hypothetical protein E7510_01895 [Ruminococcus sp.]|nr:hypothetical protein [Ruminococcus sp.]
MDVVFWVVFIILLSAIQLIMVSVKQKKNGRTVTPLKNAISILGVIAVVVVVFIISKNYM